MCSCDYETPSVFRQKVQKARKQHKCCECGETIQPGFEYNYIFGVWDGESQQYKQCLTCYKLGQKFNEVDDCGHFLGGLYECLIDGDYLNFDEESQMWKSSEDWLKIVSQNPVRCELVN